MNRAVALCLSAALACAPLVGCGGWKTLTSAGIDMGAVSFDDKGYIEKDDVKAAVLQQEQLVEAECLSVSIELDESKSPAAYVMDFASASSTYHYVVDAKTGDLIDKLEYSL